MHKRECRHLQSSLYHIDTVVLPSQANVADGSFTVADMLLVARICWVLDGDEVEDRLKKEVLGIYVH
jgi:hypothetical protein